MKKALSIIFIALLLVPFTSQQLASAVPAANQLVPVAVIATNTAPNSQNAFGLAYDSVNDIIWASSGGPIEGFDPIKNVANIGALPIDGVTGLPEHTVHVGTTPYPSAGINALGFDPTSGQLVVKVAATTLTAFDPFTGANPNTFFSPITASFLDGLDIDGVDSYWSPEGGALFGDSYKNTVKFLDNANPLQTDISAVVIPAGATSITRWAGIEVANNFVYAVAALNNLPSRTLATYDLAGNFVAVDPDGSPFANRLEDLTFDGRYLYGADFGGNRIFVFDVVGPGGIMPDEVGGEFLPIDSTALVLAGLQTSAIWMLPLLAGAVGVGSFYIKSRMNKE